MLNIILEVVSSLCEDPLVASMHDVEDLHAAARQVAARSMSRRKRRPTRFFTCQSLTRWNRRHQLRMGKAYRPPSSVKQKITKKKDVKFNKRVSGHNLFVRDEQAARRARGDKGRDNYEAFLTATHKRWKEMTDEERAPFIKLAEAQVRPLNVRLGSDMNDDCTSAASAFGIGSNAYPCSAEVLLKIVEEVVPEGRVWLRRAYERVMAYTKSDASANCIVSNTAQKLNLKSLRAKRERRKTCWQKHPGLCASDAHFSSIIALHGTMTRALKAADLCADDDDGQTLILLLATVGSRMPTGLQCCILTPSRRITTWWHSALTSQTSVGVSRCGRCADRAGTLLEAHTCVCCKVTMKLSWKFRRSASRSN